MTFSLPFPPHGEMAEKVMLMVLSQIFSNFDPLLNAVSYSDCLELQSNPSICQEDAKHTALPPITGMDVLITLQIELPASHLDGDAFVVYKCTKTMQRPWSSVEDGGFYFALWNQTEMTLCALPCAFLCRHAGMLFRPGHCI